jgi:hypothetical protein
MKQQSICAYVGVEGWAWFSRISIDRFGASKLSQENLELGQMYIERTYRGVLHIRPHISRN